MPRDKDGNVVLDLTGAVQVALLESPTYQQQLETLYLSGLDVTFERFRFDSQFFGGSSIFYTAEGPVRAGKAGRIEHVGSESVATRQSVSRVEKLTATGGELVVGFANSLMWQFAGPDNYTSNTLLDFNLVQPLLRAGGRARVLERLTISERALLANVRQMEHYRRGFYLNVVTGRDPGQGPSRRGGVFGGSGLEGFSGVGVGGFGRVGGAGGNQAGPGVWLHRRRRRAASGRLHRPVANGADHSQSIREHRRRWATAWSNCRPPTRPGESIASRSIWRGKRSTTRRANCSTTQNVYADALDNFKLQYGLPPSLDVKIADPMLDHFNLLDPELSALQIRVTDVLTVLREGALATTPEGVPDEPPAQPEQAAVARQECRARVRISRRWCSRVPRCATASQARFAAAQLDLARLEAALPARRSVLERLSIRKEAQEANIDPDLVSVERLERAVCRHEAASTQRSGSS